MRWNSVSRACLPLGIVLWSLLLCFPALEVGAGEMALKVKAIQSESESTWLQIGDDENHGIGTYERIGIWILEDGQIATTANKGTYEWNTDHGTHDGFFIATFPDGSTLTDHYRGTEKQVGGLDTWVGSGTYIAGTGRFAGVKGENTYKGGATANGMTVTDVELKLVLPD